MKRDLSRRKFLQLAGAGGAGLGLHLWLPRKAHAARAPMSRARRLVILHAAGGMRSCCLWNAHVAPQWNPFGQVSSSDKDTLGASLLPSGVQWGAGKPLVPAMATPTPLPSWGNAVLPLLTQLGDRITVLGAVDHDPSSDRGDTNHYSATRRMCTGAPDGPNGLLTVLSKEIGDTTALPPVVIGGAGLIGASIYGVGAGPLSRYRPIYVNDANDFRSPPHVGNANDPEYAKSLEAHLDQQVANAQPMALGGRAQDVSTIKQLALRYGGLLTGDALRLVVTTPAVRQAALGTTTAGAPLTNAMLIEPFGPTGFSAALGVRLLQLGAPAVAINVSGWDLHSDEDDRLKPLASEFGRMISALHFVLSRLADPSAPGKTYWDTTVVVATSEFSRDNTSAVDDGGLQIGFNRGGGSDHYGTPASRYQALPILGAGIPGGRLLRGTDDQVRPQGPPFSSPSLLATLLSMLGFDPAPYYTAPPIAEQELFG